MEQKKEAILQMLKAQGMRITKQRRLILDIILSRDCACCKEIFVEVQQKDPSVGIATVYRMIKALEEAGVINRRNLFRIEL